MGLYEKKLTDVIRVYARLTDSLYNGYAWCKDTEEFRVKSIMLTMVMTLFCHYSAHDYIVLTKQDTENFANTVTRYAHKISADDKCTALADALEIANEFTDAVGLDTDVIIDALANC